ncbi:hypothetical protein GGR57DRAFT_502659 [Xylariaceae sp. FL1272]|nr:hypothetical protein GGR57DRAFT_502659 [Xylariaceae sp. FL1272]
MSRLLIPAYSPDAWYKTQNDDVAPDIAAALGIETSMKARRQTFHETVSAIIRRGALCSHISHFLSAYPWPTQTAAMPIVKKAANINRRFIYVAPATLYSRWGWCPMSLAECLEFYQTVATEEALRLNNVEAAVWLPCNTAHWYTFCYVLMLWQFLMELVEKGDHALWYRIIPHFYEATQCLHLNFRCPKCHMDYEIVGDPEDDNRGLGQALLKRFLALPNQTLIAANRNPAGATSQALYELPKGPGSDLIIVKYDAAIEQDHFDIVKVLQEKHSISHFDIVLANAAIAKIYPLAREVKRADITEHIEVDVLSIISLFQATRGLLQKSAKEPMFAIMGSGAGSLSRQPSVPNSAYGAAKSMLYWYGIRIHREEEWLNTFVIDPGWVQTDTGNFAANHWGSDKATLEIDESVDGVFKVLTTATRENYGGKAVEYTGLVQDW